MLQRRDMLLGCSLKVKHATFSQFAKRFSSVSSDAVGKVLGRIEKGDKVSAGTDEEQKVLRLIQTPRSHPEPLSEQDAQQKPEQAVLRKTTSQI